MAQRSNAVATVDPIEALLPDLVATTTMEIDGGDVNFPRLKISHPSQSAFVPDVVPPFAIYSELNKEDDNKITIFELPKGQTKADLEKLPDSGLLVYVLAMRKGLSCNVLEGRVVPRNTEGAEFRSWGFNDPNALRGPGVDTTYNFVFYCPELDAAEHPHRCLMTRTSTNTARNMNTELRDARAAGLPAYAVPFRLTTERREQTKGGQTFRWGVFKERRVAPDMDYVKAASEMTRMINEMAPEVREAKAFDASGDEPAI